MTSVAASKIIGPERSSTVLHFIQMWWHATTFSTFYDSSILKTMTTLWAVMTQTTRDFGK